MVCRTTISFRSTGSGEMHLLAAERESCRMSSAAVRRDQDLVVGYRACVPSAAPQLRSRLGVADDRA